MRYGTLVRFVDRYVGSLATFFFSLIHYLKPSPNSKEIKNILLIELVEMGAAVMAYSSIRYIKKQIPDGNVYCLCLESTKQSWMLLDIIPSENVFAIDDSSFFRFVRSTARMAKNLSKKKIDMIIDYELFLRVSTIISFLIRSKFRAGFYRYTMEGLYRGTIYDVKCNFNQNMHIAKNLLALTKSAIPVSKDYFNYDGPIPNDEIAVPEYATNERVRAAVLKKLREAAVPPGKIILVAPTVGEQMAVRDYPQELYVEALTKLKRERLEYTFVFVGTSAHAKRCEEICQGIGREHCINFAGKTDTLQELYELFLMSELLISNDSGNPHFAAMTGLKCLVIFGPETPFMYGPLGKAVCLYAFFHSSPTLTAYNHKNAPTLSDASLRAISPERVVETAKLLLDDEARFGTVNNEIPYLV